MPVSLNDLADLISKLSSKDAGFIKNIAEERIGEVAPEEEKQRIEDTRKRRDNKILFFGALSMIAVLFFYGYTRATENYTPVISIIILIIIALFVFITRNIRNTKSNLGAQKSRYGWKYWISVTFISIGATAPIVVMNYFLINYFTYTTIGGILYLLISYDRINKLGRDLLEGSKSDLKVVLLVFWLSGGVTTLLYLIMIMWAHFFV